jgi:hypothetical protein
MCDDVVHGMSAHMLQHGDGGVSSGMTSSAVRKHVERTRACSENPRMFSSLHTWLAAAPTSSGGASSSESDAAESTACSCAGSSRCFFRRVLTIEIAGALMQRLSVVFLQAVAGQAMRCTTAPRKLAGQLKPFSDVSMYCYWWTGLACLWQCVNGRMR